MKTLGMTQNRNLSFKTDQSRIITLIHALADSHSRPPLSRKLPNPPLHRSQPPKQIQQNFERCPPTPAQKYANIPGSPIQELPTLSDLTRLQEQSKNLMPYWYKPELSREEAISYLLDKDPGWFVVRDSTTVTDGYTLTVRMSPEQARVQRKLPNGNCHYIIM